MTTFDDREHAYENKFAHDANTQFKAEARCNKLLAKWAGALLEKDVEAYAAELIAADFEEAGREDVLRKLIADLTGKADEATIRAKMDECMAEAKRQLELG